MDDILIDKRVIERQIRKGKLDAKEHSRTLAALPDSSDRIARHAPESSAMSASVSSVVAAAPVAAASMDEGVDEDDDIDDDDEDDDDDESDEAEEAPQDAAV